MDSALKEGIRLFNTRKFFEAHEALEALWLKTTGEKKTLLHGLIQVSAAFHHFTRGNLPGFRSLLEKGSTKLEKSSATLGEIHLGRFLSQLQPWREWAAWAAQKQLEISEAVGNRKTPPLPKIRA